LASEPSNFVLAIPINQGKERFLIEPIYVFALQEGHVNLSHALDTAKNCARLAEEADDQQSRKYYLNLARQWLARVDLEARFERHVTAVLHA
jgi:hypothetical protein